MYAAMDNNDIRVIIGAFEENNLLGIAIGSIVEILVDVFIIDIEYFKEGLSKTLARYM